MSRINPLGALLSTALCFGAGISAVGADKSAVDFGRMAGSYRLERDGWIYIHLEGTPDQIGYQHGSLLASEIADFLRVIKPYLEKSSKRDWNFYRDAAEKMLWNAIDPQYQREIDGIVAGVVAKGVEADRWDLVALNANQELPYYYVPWLDKKEGKAPATHAPGNCSAFVASGSFTSDGKIVMGHNAWTNYVVGTRWNIIFDIKPTEGERILMDGLPGVIASDDDFGVNSAGIMVTETTITQFEGWDPAGKPEFLRARKALQYSRSIDDFVHIMLEGNNGGYANDWLIGDNKSGEIALFELGLKNHSVRRTRDGCFFGANFPDTEKLTREETKFDTTKKDSSPNARKARWEGLIAEHKGKIGLDLAKAFETDDFDVITQQHGTNERTLCGRVEISPRGVPEWDWGPYYPGGTVQSKVIDGTLAGKMAFWGQIGHQGSDFIADQFLKEHSEYDWARGLIKDLKCQPWSRFEVDIKDR
ncbi:MAG TPA: C45 family peptidase [Isosphaeraceae bacterium]|nr:C45 family peptidase [Isosphaeraceae bacterium]